LVLFLPHKLIPLSQKVLLITPPFTQLNTPYPATAYIKGFLNTKSVSTFQADLGIEVTLALFNSVQLKSIFDNLVIETHFSDNVKRIIFLKNKYIETIDAVILFLQGKMPTLAQRIIQQGFLPQASRFQNMGDMEWAFGNNGVADKAKHFATLYLEDLSDFIKECVDEHFGFSRYAERLGRSANSFDEIYDLLQKPLSLVDEITIDLLAQKITKINPTAVAISVPFPGNLFSAFRCAQWLKQHHPAIKIMLGGGFPNTELRSLKEKRVFEFVDFITLDDGETPIENLLEYLDNKRPIELLKRTFALHENEVHYFNGSLQRDYKQQEVGTPDYADLVLDKYISAIEVVNPMHRLWSDGRWNKLTMAHGCYWAKCTFCDVSLDYIQNYQATTVQQICDRMEAMIAQTSVTGFHFVDEAAPPAMMRDLAIEIIKRKMTVSWWTNIRFEKSFTNDLCYLLKASGCIAVSGGLEVASERLLKLIDKGVSLEQVANVLKNFKQNDIMVHAYLMYGYPTQTIQETLDSLEVVRQLFKNNILQSGFWHQFALTVHSPIGKNPDAFSIQITSKEGTFANNDLTYSEKKGIRHEEFSFGLKKSLYNYMQHNCLDDNLQSFFEQKIPSTSVDKNFIQTILNKPILKTSKPTTKVIWLGSQPTLSYFTKSKKGNTWQMATLVFQHEVSQVELTLSEEQGKWFAKIIETLTLQNPKTYQDLQQDFENEIINDDFELFWHNKIMKGLEGKGLILL
jgi:hypothetical protein